MKILYRKTSRLIIRPLEKKDYNQWKQAHSTMKAPQNTWDLGPRQQDSLTKADFKKILRGQAEKRKSDTFYDLGVFDKSGLLVGVVSIMEVTRGISQTSYMGYRIFNNHWGRGFGKEAIRAMIDIGFKDLKLHRIEAGIEQKNLRSIRLAKSLGMRREGVKKRALFLRNTWIDLVMFTLTSEDLGYKYDARNLKWKNFRHIQAVILSTPKPMINRQLKISLIPQLFI